MVVIGCSWSWIVVLAKLTQGSTIRIFFFFFFFHLVVSQSIRLAVALPTFSLVPLQIRFIFSSILKCVRKTVIKKLYIIIKNTFTIKYEIIKYTI